MKIENEKKAGGLRAGSGRKVGTGKFQEPTEVIRIPTSQKSVITDFLSAYTRKQHDNAFKVDLDAVGDFEFPTMHHVPLNIALFNSKVPAGNPSPADDHVESRLDPSEFLVDKVDATFFVTIQGYSMIDAGLLPGDKAVVDRSKLAAIGDIVLAMVDGDYTIKTLARSKDGLPLLLPANKSGEYKPIEVKKHMQVEIWGVVTGSFRRYK
ncbi:SOS response UmuD protein [Methylophilaceae bacterium 11]|jgi:DNA polymerase V|uniref:LexA family protein n=1 Tax=unclassified Methylotenera TaxID=2643294 RepID=UPI00036A3A87|nr:MULTISPECIES: translesion error-prone DNA polymerase V autoproteolytic subunit [unclassified Methylotenera]EUJ09230.1 SOS response UmuD protein [Methylophilaceae bacterium 11]